MVVTCLALMCHTIKTIFHCKLGTHWVINANEMSTNNMKSTGPTPAPTPGDPMQPIFHRLALVVHIGGNVNFRFGVGGNTNFSVFRYQHVGIPNAKL